MASEHVPGDDKSALVVLVPEAEPVVAALRARFDYSAQFEMPAHITLLHPFQPPAAITDSLVEGLAEFFRTQPAFSFTLSGVCGFPSVIYLAPEPAEPFDRMTRELVARHPDCLPYRGAIRDPIPHLTVGVHPLASDLRALSEELLAAVTRHGPVTVRAREAWLMCKISQRWRKRAAFALAEIA
jgi:2'-5' RNA ligase